MKKKRDDQRFAVVYQQSTGIASGVKILVDRETRVQYLYFCEGQGAGLSPLLGLDGRPIPYSERLLEEG